MKGVNELLAQRERYINEIAIIRSELDKEKERVKDLQRKVDEYENIIGKKLL